MVFEFPVDLLLSKIYTGRWAAGPLDRCSSTVLFSEIEHAPSSWWRRIIRSSEQAFHLGRRSYINMILPGPIPRNTIRHMPTTPRLSLLLLTSFNSKTLAFQDSRPQP